MILGRMLLAAVLCGGAWWLWPVEHALWRRVVAVMLAGGLSFQVAASLWSASQGRAAALKAWLECGAFPLVMMGVYFLPEARGWILLVGGWSWRFLVRNLWK